MKLFRIALMFVISSMALNAIAQESNPTLKETVDWLQSKSYLITYVEGRSLREVLDGTYHAKWDAALISPCTLVLSSAGLGENNEKGKPAKQSPGISAKDIHPWGFNVQPPGNPSTITIPLSSLNPQKVTTKVFEQMIGSSGSVTIQTTDNKEIIVWRGADKTFNATSITIAFREHEMSERVAKALTHAINLCGGHGDRKEPF